MLSSIGAYYNVHWHLSYLGRGRCICLTLKAAFALLKPILSERGPILFRLLWGDSSKECLDRSVYINHVVSPSLICARAV